MSTFGSPFRSRSAPPRACANAPKRPVQDDPGHHYARGIYIAGASMKGRHQLQIIENGTSTTLSYGLSVSERRAHIITTKKGPDVTRKDRSLRHKSPLQTTHTSNSDDRERTPSPNKEFRPISRAHDSSTGRRSTGSFDASWAPGAQYASSEDGRAQSPSSHRGARSAGSEQGRASTPTQRLREAIGGIDTACDWKWKTMARRSSVVQPSSASSINPSGSRSPTPTSTTARRQSLGGRGPQQPEGRTAPPASPNSSAHLALELTHAARKVARKSLEREALRMFLRDEVDFVGMEGGGLGQGLEAPVQSTERRYTQDSDTESSVGGSVEVARLQQFRRDVDAMQFGVSQPRVGAGGDAAVREEEAMRRQRRLAAMVEAFRASLAQELKCIQPPLRAAGAKSSSAQRPTTSTTSTGPKSAGVEMIRFPHGSFPVAAQQLFFPSRSLDDEVVAAVRSDLLLCVRDWNAFLTDQAVGELDTLEATLVLRSRRKRTLSEKLALCEAQLQSEASRRVDLQEQLADTVEMAELKLGHAAVHPLLSRYPRHFFQQPSVSSLAYSSVAAGSNRRGSHSQTSPHSAAEGRHQHSPSEWAGAAEDLDEVEEREAAARERAYMGAFLPPPSAFESGAWDIDWRAEGRRLDSITGAHAMGHAAGTGGYGTYTSGRILGTPLQLHLRQQGDEFPAIPIGSRSNSRSRSRQGREEGGSEGGCGSSGRMRSRSPAGSTASAPATSRASLQGRNWAGTFAGAGGQPLRVSMPPPAPPPSTSPGSSAGWDGNAAKLAGKTLRGAKAQQAGMDRLASSSRGGTHDASDLATSRAADISGPSLMHAGWNNSMLAPPYQASSKTPPTLSAQGTRGGMDLLDATDSLLGGASEGQAAPRMAVAPQPSLLMRAKVARRGALRL
ncbi:hypothetical protein B484DRAFT_414882 [Ochromonadaceae sp. CCMP2298]|nr:hypothetical protein B484DRAFT_414882 [Ochromonadaceae sp. CCMP2298]